MTGYSAPIVKAEAEEEPDYGGPTEEGGGPKVEGGPQRAMPDYGDLVDDDEGAGPGAQVQAKTAKEENAQASNAPPRKEAIHVAGVQRLTRTHLAEVFASKDLPMFRWIEWLEDDKVLCVFGSAEDAALALRSAEEGFCDTAAEDARPGPGLWRAQRCMLEFRLATQEDKPAEDFRKKHRGGQQVREYRFWESMKDMDRYILGEQDVESLKRLAPSGEDAWAAADWDDDQQRRKRLRRGVRPGEEEEEDIDLLNKMAAQDKHILTKEESGEATSLPKSNEAPVVDVKFEEDMWQQGRGGDDDAEWRGGGKWRGPWQHDDRGEEWSWDNYRDSWDGQGAWGGERRGDGGDSRKRRRGGGGSGGGGGGRGGKGGDGGGGSARTESSAAAKDFSLDLDDAERAKRARRANRFGSEPAAGASTAPPAAAAAAAEE